MDSKTNSIDPLIKRLNISVIGQGYVGLELALALATKGHQVFGIDISESKVRLISRGQSPVENVDSAKLSEIISSGNYVPTIEFERVRVSEVVIICVPTPVSRSGEPNLAALIAAVENISPYLNEGTLIVNESTSFPGTLRKIIKQGISELRPDLEEKLLLAVAPERVSPGNKIPLAKIPRVIGGLDTKAVRKANQIYSEICESIHLTETPEIAESSKLLENIFRQINIAFINEFNLICRELQIDTRKVIEAANTKPYGFMKFDPGAGIGGHCIPVDPLYFQYVAEEIGRRSEFIELATLANSLHPKRLLELVLGRSKVKNPRILILGVAYKSGISDTRESPAELFFEAAKARNLDCGWLDPLVDSWLGSDPSSIDEKWDIAIVVTQQPDLPVQELLTTGVEIYDFTGGFKELDGVVQI